MRNAQVLLKPARILHVKIIIVGDAAVFDSAQRICRIIRLRFRSVEEGLEMS